MPLLTDQLWTLECGVCERRVTNDPGRFPEGWRRLTIGLRMDSAPARIGAALDAWRGARFEDWVCSPGCAVAAVSRSFDDPRERARRPHELAAIAARAVA